MLIRKDDLLDLFYDCESWDRLNNGAESVDIKELIEKLEKKEDSR